MKTHRSTQLFLYCSGGESSVKCVRTALKMEASNEEQRGVVRFLVPEGTVMCHKVKTSWNAVDGIIHLLDNNVRPHTANLGRYKVQRFGWETLEHPPHSPDFFPCDFHIFGDLKKDIRGRWFRSDEEVQEWVRLWINQRPTSFYKTGLMVSSPSGINLLTFLTITFE